MAVSPVHGKNAVVLTDEHNLSPFLKSIAISASMDPADTTTFGSNDKTFIPGLRDAQISAGGLFAASTTTVDDIANYFDGALGGSTKLVVTVGPAGDSTGRRAYLLTADPTAWNVSDPITDIVSVDIELQASSGYDAGRWLRPLSTAASTGSNGGVAFTGSTTAGGSTLGGVGHLHLTAQSTLTSVTFKIQHSTSGSTWADLITFTAATAETFQRSTVSGTIKERVRSTISALTGGAGKSVTAAVAFARNGSPKT